MPGPSRIWDLLDQNVEDLNLGANRSENSKLYTTNRLKITNNKINLPFKAIGDAVFNIALIFNTRDSNVIEAEATINISNDGTTGIFDPLDELNDRYAVITYLTYKVTDDTT